MRKHDSHKRVTLGEEDCRPWYMSGGTRRPLPAVKSPKSGRRMALLWPEEDPGSDRITNQLMFVPPSSSAGESNGQRLKKILMYYGLGSWFHLKPGRDMFRKARCPVDTCTITLDQKQTADADAILYHDRFAHPGHPRPPKQVRRSSLLYSRGSTERHDRAVSPASSSSVRIFEIRYEAEALCDSAHPLRECCDRSYKTLRLYIYISLKIHLSHNYT